MLFVVGLNKIQAKLKRLNIFIMFLKSALSCIRSFPSFMYLGYSVLILSSILSFGQLSQANPSLLGSGFGMTTGYVTNSYNLHSVANNPAGLDFLIDAQSSKRLGLVLPNVGLQVELGDASGFKKITDSLNTIIEKSYTNPADLNKAKTDAESLIAQIQEGARVQIGLNLNPLLTPVVWRSEKLGGTLALNFELEAGLDSSFKSSTIELDQANNKLSTRAGLDTSVIRLLHTSLGYSKRPFTSLTEVGEKWGRVDVGARLNLYSATAQRAYFLAGSGDTNQISNLGTSASSSQFGVDLGLMNTYTYGQLGLTYYNVNTPKFDFPSLTSADAKAVAASNSSLMLDRTVAFKPQAVLEGSLFNTRRSLALQASYALNPSVNLLGQDIQYSTLSLGVYPKFDSSLINVLTPTLRLGYRVNQVGSKLDIYSFGFSLFRALNFDAWWSPKMIGYDSSEVPRIFGASLGFTTSF